ncbi:MAG: hypothetical protein KF869_15605 [Phycisphaeraceae bacterium]|nr:hypothetical protein [Phycisphaeraceae bacterium]
MYALLASFHLPMSPSTIGSPVDADVSDPPWIAIHLGLTPEALCAIGADADDADDMLARLEGAGTARHALCASLSLCSESQGQQTALGSLDSQQESLFELACDGLPEGAAHAIVALQVGMEAGLPVDLAATVQSPFEARSLRRLMIAEARSQRLGHSLPQEHASRLAAARALPAAVTIRARMAEHLGGVRDAYQGHWTGAQPPPP